MKKIQLTEVEIQMILYAIDSWKMTNHGEHSKKELRAVNSAEKILTDILNS